MHATLTIHGAWYESCSAAVIWVDTVGVLRPQRQERDGARGNDIRPLLRDAVSPRFWSDPYAIPPTRGRAGAIRGPDGAAEQDDELLSQDRGPMIGLFRRRLLLSDG